MNLAKLLLLLSAVQVLAVQAGQSEQTGISGGAGLGQELGGVFQTEGGNTVLLRWTV